MNNVNNLENGETGKSERGSAWDKLKNIPFIGRKAEAPAKTEEEPKEMTPEEKIRAEIEDEIESLGNEISDKQDELRELHKRIEMEGQPNGTYREVGGDVYDNRVEVGQNVKDAAIALSKELGHLTERKQDLMNPRIQEAEIKRRLEEQEQQALDQKAFNLALRVPRIETRLLAFDQQIQKLEDAGNEEAAENVRKAKQLFIEQEAIPVGRGLMEKIENGEIDENLRTINKEGSDSESSEEKTEEAEETAEEPIVETAAEKAHRSLSEIYEDRAKARANALSPKDAYGAYLQDKYKVQQLNDRLKRLNETPTAGMSAREHRKHVEAIKETEARLRDYGKGMSDRGNSSDYDLLTARSNTMSDAAVNYGKRRMANFSLLESGLEGDAKRAVKKALKRHGIKDIPSDWNDRDYSAQELERMSSYVMMAVHEQERK